MASFVSWGALAFFVWGPVRCEACGVFPVSCQISGSGGYQDMCALFYLVRVIDAEKTGRLPVLVTGYWHASEPLATFGKTVLFFHGRESETELVPCCAMMKNAGRHAYPVMGNECPSMWALQE